MKNDTKRDYFWNTLGVFVQNATSPLLLVIVARINGVYDSGLFAFAFAVSIVFWMVGLWGGRTYQVSDVKHEFTTQSYIVARLLLAGFMIAGALVFSLLNNYSQIKSELILALVTFKAIESIADTFYGIIQVHGKLYVTGISLVIKTTMGLSAFILVDILTKNITTAVLSVIVVNLAVFLLYDVRQARNLDSIVLNPGQVRQYIYQATVVLKRCLAVFIVSFLAMLSLNIPRFFIDRFHEDQNAYFGIMSMPVTLTLLVVTFIIQPNVVALSRFYTQGLIKKFDYVIRRISLITIIIGVFVLFITYLIGVRILTAVFNIDFSSYNLELVVLTVGAILNALVGVGITVLTIMRRFKGLFYSLLLTNLLLIPMSYVAIQQHGMFGGIVLFLCMSAVQVVLLFFVYRFGLREANVNA